MRIQNNVPALNAHRFYTLNNTGMTKSIAKLSSGYRINSAADDAAGLAISEKMRAQIRGLTMASKNAQDATSLIQTAEGGLQEIDNMLQRIRELVDYAANDTQEHNAYGTGDRQKIQDEINQLTKEIDSMAGRVEFNKKKLINGELAGLPENAAKLLADVAAAQKNLTIQQDAFAKASKSVSEASTGAQASRDVFNSTYSNPAIDELLTKISLNGGETVADLVGDVTDALSDLRTKMSTSSTTAGINNVIKEAVAAVNDAMLALGSEINGINIDTIETIDMAKSAFSSLTKILGGAGDWKGVSAANATHAQFADGTVVAITDDDFKTILSQGGGVSDADVDTTHAVINGQTVQVGADNFAKTTNANLNAADAKLIMNDGTLHNVGDLRAATWSAAAYGTTTNAIMIDGKLFKADTGDGNRYVSENGDVLRFVKGPAGTEVDLASGESINNATAVQINGEGAYIRFNTTPGTMVAGEASFGKFTEIDPLTTASGASGTSRFFVNGEWVGGVGTGLTAAADRVVTVDTTTAASDPGTGDKLLLGGKLIDIDTGVTDFLAVTDAVTAGLDAAGIAAARNAAEGIMVNGKLEYTDVSGTPTVTLVKFEALAAGATDNENSLKTAFETLKDNYDVYDLKRKELADAQGLMDDARTTLALRQSVLSAAPKTGGLYFQVGANANQGMQLYINSVKSDSLGIGDGNGVSYISVVKSNTGADLTSQLDTLDFALSYVTTERAKLGAAQNRLEYTMNSLDISAENLTSAESRIRDVDMAKEMSNFTRQNILFQASTAMLAQANAMPQGVLQLLG